MEKNEIKSLIESMGITLEAKFVPFSASRDSKSKFKSLNWDITVKVNGRDVLTTPYSAGIAHCPAGKRFPHTEKAYASLDYRDAIEREVETGLATDGRFNKPVRHKRILPDIVDVLYSLISDADVIDYDSFEDWAECIGYDTDSRKAEKAYRDCLEISLKLRNRLGDENVRKLRDAFQDY